MVENEAWLRNEVWVNYICKTLEEQFPNLAFTGYKLIAADTPDYNCVAWAAEDTQNWWWPDPHDVHYWLPNVLREETLEAFIQAFQALEYKVCETAVLEVGCQKIAIYSDEEAIPTHVARQLANGNWTSKIGQYETIEHPTLDALTGDEPAYGSVSCFMKRILPS